MLKVGQAIYINDRVALITGLTSTRIEYRFWNDTANTTYSCPLSELKADDNDED